MADWTRAGLGAFAFLATMAAVMSAAVAAVTPSRDAGTVSGAITDSAPAGAVTGSDFTVIPPVPPLDPAGINPAATSDTPHRGLPRSGESYAILSSGDATLALDGPQSKPASIDNEGDDGGHGPSFDDVVTLRIDLNVPASTNCLQLDFRYLSEEFPEFVDTQYNDAFLAELDSSNFTADADKRIHAPNNFAFAFREDGAGTDVASVNSADFSADKAAGTIYDGATPLMRASTPVTPGAHSVFLTVVDQTDAVLDSAAFIDHLVLRNLSPESCVPGTLTCQSQPANRSAGDSGDNVLTGTGDRDVMVGRGGDDRIFGLGSGDCLYGHADDDRVVGGRGGDLIAGGRGDDRLKGETGRDEIHGGRGGDRVRGGTGKDTLRGNGGLDTLHGGKRPDLVKGHRGRDKLVGGRGRDKLKGGKGNDRLKGSRGADLLNCGKGSRDLAIADGKDTVRDNCEIVVE